MGWSSDTTRQFTMSHIIADEFHSDGVEESDNNNVDESINNNVNESIDNNVNESIVNESINNNVDEPFNNIEVRAEGDDDVERNPMSMNNRKSKAKKKEEKEQKKEEKKDTFRKALKDLKDGKFTSINSCAKAHGVPASTLGDLHRSGQEYKGPGRRVTVFTEDEEKKIVTYIRHQVKFGFGLSFFELMRVIEELAEGLKAANPKRKFPESWDKFLPEKYFVYNFAKRHLLTLRSTMELNKARSILSPEDL